jgi:hypothetical protein
MSEIESFLLILAGVVSIFIVLIVGYEIWADGEDDERY